MFFLRYHPHVARARAWVALAGLACLCDDAEASGGAAHVGRGRSPRKGADPDAGLLELPHDPWRKGGLRSPLMNNCSGRATPNPPEPVTIRWQTVITLETGWTVMRPQGHRACGGMWLPGVQRNDRESRLVKGERSPKGRDGRPQTMLLHRRGAGPQDN